MAIKSVPYWTAACDGCTKPFISKKGLRLAAKALAEHFRREIDLWVALKRSQWDQRDVFGHKRLLCPSCLKEAKKIGVLEEKDGRA